MCDDPTLRAHVLHEHLEDECCAPESGAIIGGREDPWADDMPSPTHLFPRPSHEPTDGRDL